MLSGNPFFKNPIMKEAIWVFSKKRKVFHRYVHQFSSIALLCLILQLHGLQGARLPCPSPTPGAYTESCPSSQWCHPTISPSVGPFSSHLQSFPASGSFLESQFLASGGQSIGVSASASVHNISVIYFHSLINNDNNNDNLYAISNQMTISGNFLKHLPCSFLSIFLSAPSLCVSLSSLFWKLSSFMGLSDSLLL